jgi:oligopeptide/dipeptide ABC transporter ATP-binding protein
MPLLEVKNLQVCFRTRKGIMRAVDGVSFSVEAGKTLALVGESGSGKSVSAMSILRLLDDNGFVEGGEILFQTETGVIDLAAVPLEQMYSIRGDRISVIFQEPMTALNPVFTIGRQLSEPFLIHRNMSKKEAWQAALEMLKAVKIPNPEGVMKDYAHRLSGGMRQRVMIAMALACKPNLLIADEPTTALDVTIQAQVLALMKSLQEETGNSVLLITHDLAVVAQVADLVAVMYLGRIVERGNVVDIIKDPLHPYTFGLLRSLPGMSKNKDRLPSIPGSVPSLTDIPPGCPFHPRCEFAKQGLCDCGEPPPETDMGNGRMICCYRAAEIRQLLDDKRRMEDE